MKSIVLPKPRQCPHCGYTSEYVAEATLNNAGLWVRCFQCNNSSLMLAREGATNASDEPERVQRKA